MVGGSAWKFQIWGTRFAGNLQKSDQTRRLGALQIYGTTFHKKQKDSGVVTIPREGCGAARFYPFDTIIWPDYMSTGASHLDHGL